jgi:peptidoglycan/LPS O-acetylase OafA/YrhL
MFGVCRTVLAVLVVLNHIAGAHKLGWHAVFGFYILSGYLMTLIMTRNYGYSISGTWKYFINRFLRIYPIYWAACLLSLLLISLLGSEYTTRFDVNLYVPHDVVSMIPQCLAL